MFISSIFFFNYICKFMLTAHGHVRGYTNTSTPVIHSGCLCWTLYSVVDGKTTWQCHQIYRQNTWTLVNAVKGQSVGCWLVSTLKGYLWLSLSSVSSLSWLVLDWISSSRIFSSRSSALSSLLSEWVFSSPRLTFSFASLFTRKHSKPHIHNSVFTAMQHSQADQHLLLTH